MWIRYPWNTSHIHSLYDSVARTFENKNHIKIEIIRHRFMENGCIWEGISLTNACWVIQSVFYQVVNAVQWWCVYRKCSVKK